MRRAMRVFMVSVVGSAAVVLAPVGPAQAESPTDALVVASVMQAIPSKAGGIAPACIKRYVNNSISAVTLKNKCRKTMRVKVIVKRGKDSPCMKIKRNKSKGWSYISMSTYPLYHKTVVC